MAEPALRDATAPHAPHFDAVSPGTGAARAVPVLPALRAVLPVGLRAGSLVGLDGPGAASLGAALVAGASRHGGPDGTGGWCGVVGLPAFGVRAAAGMGAAPERLLLVDEPGARWADVVAALLEAVDLVLLRPPGRTDPAAVRRLSALARRHGAVLALAGAVGWPGVRLRLRTAAPSWEGLGTGHGRLRGRRAEVVAEGRDAPGAGRRARLWLPAPDGTVAPDDARPALQIVREPGGVSDGAPVHRLPAPVDGPARDPRHGRSPEEPGPERHVSQPGTTHPERRAAQPGTSPLQRPDRAQRDVPEPGGGGAA
ncbi:hypothetical protein [Actinomadura sp. WMMB 499]|uniref:hypothetical protein n=1 Tax=Actinomadura sp. WMMB 499 TaxID=1219491 RepID=UPI0020C75FFA|nr:hypothetical protein [Actinomadura sp. WMMB 499]